ncbi:uncharacterized protein LOC142560167 [Dermacentor variabilis]|uniref:uncharacterized protein LOC142560167 n=1 Tax=Dermacentor variabilis TaxID=34621 RepID=UPI003F5CA372
MSRSRSRDSGQKRGQTTKQQQQKSKTQNKEAKNRPNLSTQDILLLLKEEVLTNVPKAGEHIVMAVDIEGAFDNLSHKGILDGLAETNCGQRTYQYIRSFLNQRTPIIKVEDEESQVIRPPNKGTPQDAVISPALFNIDMIGLARKKAP